MAIAQVWNDTLATTSQLARNRLDSLPVVAMLGQDTQGPKVTPFSGAAESGTQFSIWLRRLEDVMRHLDGVAREKVEEMANDARKDYSQVVSHLKGYFESPQQRYVARQKLSSCKQEPAESCSAFANRVLNLVRAATTGQDIATQKDRVLEEFVARLRPDVRYYVKLDNPATFEQAVAKAQTVEQLLAEATAERLICPSKPTAEVHVIERPQSDRPATFIPPRDKSRFAQPQRNRNISQRRLFQAPTPRRLPITDPRRAECFNCGGIGHFRNQCPSPADINPRPRDSGESFPSRGNAVVPSSVPRRRNAQLMSCDPALSSSSSDPSLDRAHQRIAELSLSLQDSQNQLDQSRARVAALLQRNEELAQSAFDPSSPTVCRSLLPDVRMLCLCAIALLCLLNPVSAADVWLCPKENPTNIFFIPESYNCSGLLPKSTTPVDVLTLHIFRPNTKMYSSAAFLCKIIRHEVTYSVNFFGARREHHSELHLPVSPEECKLMSRHKRCIHGDMTEFSGIWRSSNEASFEFPSAPFGCCVEHSVRVTNCYLYETRVHARHDSDAPQSSVGDMSSCAYKDGTCTLSDGSAVIWSPDQEEQCRYIPVTKMTGFIMDTVWISKSREFALSWSNTSSVVQDCLKQLIITDQGYGIAQVSRKPRSDSPSDTGIVTTNQLAAQLLAVEGTMQLSMESIFHNALRTLCERTNILAITLHTALRSNPTLTMRNLLDRRDIFAEHLGNGYVTIRRCIPLPSRSVSFVPFNHTCFGYPQVQITLPSGSVWRAFLVPATGVITNKAPIVDCDSVTPFFLKSQSSIERLDPVTGALAPVSTTEAVQVSSLPQIS
ncbi:zinc knuckle, partial [Oesophagostomum dentatum]